MRFSRRRFLISALALIKALLGWPNVAGASDKAEWDQGSGFRRKSVQPIGIETGFTEMRNGDCGVSFTNRLSDNRVHERHNLMNGAGVAVGDFDNDGQVDFFLCNKEGPSALYRNLGGWRFEDVAVKAGVACANQSSTGATFVDLDGDGWLDLLVTSFGGPNACFLNLQNGAFTNITEMARFGSNENITSIAAGDLDGDGDIDLYLNNFGMVSIMADPVSVGTRQVGGKTVATGRFAHRVRFENGRMIEMGEPDFLLWNLGKGRFTNAFWPERFRDSEGRPMTPTLDFGLAVQIRDIDGDGRPDIYVCNDFHTPDRLWLNQGTGILRAAPSLTQRVMSHAAMGVDFADIDRDGDMDFFVVEMLPSNPRGRLRQRIGTDAYRRTPGQFLQTEDIYRNALYLNNGDGTYSEIARAAGVTATDWSWAPIFIDVDLDGFEDILVTNGNIDNLNDLDREINGSKAGKSRGQRRPFVPLITPNAAYKNRGDLTFAAAAHAWGFDSTRISHGAALGDFDNDGDLDVVVNCLNAPPLLYRNNSTAPRALARLKGRAPNTQGIGAKITFRSADGFAQTQEIVAGGRYLSGDDPVRVFACVRKAPHTLEVRWPTGVLTIVSNVAPNSIYELSEPESTALPAVRPVESPPQFSDVSERLPHQHTEAAFDDFAAQPLLPRRLSQSGPAVVWSDVDGDGLDDLVIGSGRTGTVSVWRNSAEGFRTVPVPALSDPLPGDSAGIVFLPGNPSLVITAISQLEREPEAKPELLIAPIGGAVERIEIPVPMIPGPLVLLDLDADGDLDLFVAGTSAPGRFPEAAGACVFINQMGRFSFDARRSATFATAGLVNSAVATDLNSDGWPDLALATEWGPIRIFLNLKGAFADATDQMRLSGARGLWRSVSAGDFDGDGRMDLVGGNAGRNTSSEEFRAKPLRLYYGDWNARGVIDQIEARFVPGLNDYAPVRNLDLLSKALPFVRQNFLSHHAFSESTVAQALMGATNHSGAATKFLETAWFENSVFLNRGERFEIKALPMAAQLSPAFGIVVADFNGDSREDLFLAQNHFAARPDDERCDAGFGLLMNGDGQGNFDAVPAKTSGLRVYGEQRGCAASDYDGDGRLDLVVTQNGAATRLFHNELATPGLRIMVKGPAHNPAGIGASVQLLAGDVAGPAREIRAGQGYWSQDGGVQVMNWFGATAVRVRWPGGRVQTIPLHDKHRGVEVAFVP